MPYGAEPFYNSPMVSVPDLGVSGRLYDHLVRPLDEMLHNKPVPGTEQRVKDVMELLNQNAAAYRSELDRRYENNPTS